MTDLLLTKLRKFDFTTDSLIFRYEVEGLSRPQWLATKTSYEVEGLSRPQWLATKTSHEEYLKELEGEILEQNSQADKQQKISEYKLAKMEYDALLKAYPDYVFQS